MHIRTEKGQAAKRIIQDVMGLKDKETRAIRVERCMSLAAMGVVVLVPDKSPGAVCFERGPRWAPYWIGAVQRAADGLTELAAHVATGAPWWELEGETFSPSGTKGKVLRDRTRRKWACS